MRKQEIKNGLKDAFGVVLGFIPISMAFGILAKSADLALLETVSFSIFVFAGASQFMAINLLIAHVGYQEIILTTLLVNFRHFLFATSLSNKITNKMKKFRPLIAFGLSDEIFAIASLKKDELSSEYLLTLEFMAYSSLVFGTFLGYILGNILPEIIQLSFGIALYALFIAIIVPEVKKFPFLSCLIIASGIVNTVLQNFLNLEIGWSIVLSIIIVSFFGVIVQEN